jgi:hypothetical protein
MTVQCKVDYAHSIADGRDAATKVNLSEALGQAAHKQKRNLVARLSGYDLPASAFSQLEAVLFDQPAARALIRKAFDDPVFQNPTSTSGLATFACLYGDTDLALAAVRRAYVD